jgi:hypothetical protein
MDQFRKACEEFGVRNGAGAVNNRLGNSNQRPHDSFKLNELARRFLALPEGLIVPLQVEGAVVGDT